MFHSPFPDIAIPNGTLFDQLFGDLTPEDGKRIAIIDGNDGSETTFSELRDSIESVASALAARGIGPSSVVALLAPNSPRWVTAFHGTLRAGATLTAVNLMSTVEDIAKQLRRTSTALLFSARSTLEVARAAADLAGLDAANIVLVDGHADEESIGRWLAEERDPVNVSIDPATAVAVLAFSSGTTGTPKAVALSHRNLVSNVEQLTPIVALGPDDRLVAVLPYFHIYGMTVLMNYAIRTRTAVVTLGRFELAQFLRVVSEYRCTYLHVAPPIVLALAKHPAVDDYDLSHVHTVFSGAAPLDAATATRVAERLGVRVTQGYGMSELSPASHATPTGPTDVPSGSVGYLTPNTVCRLVDIETGEDIQAPEAGTSRPGELLVRGPQVMLGYSGDREATDEIIDADGFLHTGDIAVIHEGGYFTIIDRVKELVKYKGYQVPPAELEAVLVSHPEIADAAVVAAFDADGQELPKAFVVRATNTQLDEETVMAFVAERVAPYKKVRRVEFIDAIPKSAAGKILRKELRARERTADVAEH